MIDSRHPSAISSHDLSVGADAFLQDGSQRITGVVFTSSAEWRDELPLQKVRRTLAEREVRESFLVGFRARTGESDAAAHAELAMKTFGADFVGYQLVIEDIIAQEAQLAPDACSAERLTELWQLTHTGV